MLAIATCLTLPEPDVDERPLMDALAAAGVPARLCAWDDASVDWAQFRAVVIRSTWNYHHHADAFLRWVSSTAAVTRLVNPAAVVRWNAHKGYLLALAARGLPVVPTELVTRGSSADATALLSRWPELVAKPAVSAGSFATIRARAGDDAILAAHLARWGEERDMLVQPYQPSVETTGERCLVFIAGAFTHAVRKRARFAGDEEATSLVPIAADERALAERVLEVCARETGAAELLYGRVDLVRDAAGALQVMEVELIEPSLFLRLHAPALHRLVAALAAL